MEYLLRNSETIENIVNSIIRPPRSQYHQSDLGPTKKLINGITVERADLHILNNKNQLLSCSLTFPRNQENKLTACCIYLHGNGGCQLESTPCLEALIQQNIALFALDTSGSGRSEGQFITLGMEEQNDLGCALTFLEEIFQFEEYFLWGRSMGAVTALLYQSNQKKHQKLTQKISALILDSPFESFQSLCVDIGSKKLSIPGFLQDSLINVIRKRIITKLQGIDVFEIQLRDKVKTISTPALYIYSEQDTLVPSAHSKSLLKNHGLSQVYIQGGTQPVQRQQANSVGCVIPGQQFKVCFLYKCIYFKRTKTHSRPFSHLTQPKEYIESNRNSSFNSRYLQTSPNQTPINKNKLLKPSQAIQFTLTDQEGKPSQQQARSLNVSIHQLARSPSPKIINNTMRTQLSTINQVQNSHQNLKMNQNQFYNTEINQSKLFSSQTFQKQVENRDSFVQTNNINNTFSNVYQNLGRVPIKTNQYYFNKK